jgi:hypothetical protein
MTTYKKTSKKTNKTVTKAIEAVDWSVTVRRP